MPSSGADDERRPEESGVFTPGKIFGGRFCTRIPLEELQPGDFIEFYMQGIRTREVKFVQKARKYTYVQFEPGKYNSFKTQRVDIRDVRFAWRPERRERKVTT